VVEESDEILAITLGGGVIRTRVAEVRETGRDTMGVQLINLGKRDAVVGIARNAEGSAEDEVEAEEGDAAPGSSDNGTDDTTGQS
jgi:DNA gyrase subunit A